MTRCSSRSWSIRCRWVYDRSADDEHDGSCGGNDDHRKYDDGSELEPNNHSCADQHNNCGSDHHNYGRADNDDRRPDHDNNRGADDHDDNGPTGRSAECRGGSTTSWARHLWGDPECRSGDSHTGSGWFH